ncbi:serine hydrolase [Parasphingorhabdus sp. DH2-15]|uniref:serine hydrolase n=1 Tax=Parasphingorhabdus sp. DH2-15 TaxID=3444112 RepID=UPI003F6828FB
MVSRIASFRLLSLSLLLPLLASCASTPEAPPPRVSQVPPPTIQTVQSVPKESTPQRISTPPAALRARLFELWREFPGTTGIAVQRIDGDWTLSHRGNQYFPQQSVSKLWVALTLLDKVDRGEISLNDPIQIGPDDLTLFHQPLATRVRREGGIVESAGTLLDMAITRSDNSANDALLRHAGGPRAVRRFIDRNNLGRIRFGPGERLLQSQIAGISWRQNLSSGRAFQAARAQQPIEERRAALNAYLADPIDGASPEAIAMALTRLARGELLSPESTKLILDTMGRTRSGPRRLKGGVPPGWGFLHKTGTGQDLPPVSTGYNDIGIMTAPDGTRYAVVVMLGDTTASIPQRMTLMQHVSRAVADNHGQ